ncbi:hypothetical protein FGIG_06887 [Fasciola gigantica]|uniref:Uncharacterized protein n=1 Tax=Fasciola gigantica TaxID=46835 RepID=A0A504YDY6_FASGI|nr:hypothetical protein FGIG_06887 [Fasciola gigantica]
MPDQTPRHPARPRRTGVPRRRKIELFDAREIWLVFHICQTIQMMNKPGGMVTQQNNSEVTYSTTFRFDNHFVCRKTYTCTFFNCDEHVLLVSVFLFCFF